MYHKVTLCPLVKCIYRRQGVYLYPTTFSKTQEFPMILMILKRIK